MLDWLRRRLGPAPEFRSDEVALISAMDSEEDDLNETPNASRADSKRISRRSNCRHRRSSASSALVEEISPEDINIQS